MYEVGLTAPQTELPNGTIVMFWYPDQEIEAKNKTEARKIVNEMIENEEIDYDLMDENGDELTSKEIKILQDYEFEIPDPEIDWVKKI
tara:strand:+ start:218 stop:481 length:264 start_codon:yes stop_codon:yes gene_type:complete